MRAGNPTCAATLIAVVRSVLLATFLLLLAAPAAQAAVTVDMKVSSGEIRYGQETEVTGTALLDGVPFAGQPVALEAKSYPFEGAFEVIETGVTGPDGTYTFKRELERNTDLRVTTGGAVAPRARVYVAPALVLSYQARNARVIRVTQRYRVPRGVRLDKPTIFYVGKHGAKRVPRAAVGELERIRAGRYRSSAIVRLPDKWNGRFRYASCFRYTGGSGMGNPRSSCPQRFKF
jgi:hypothetical protein